MSVWIGTPTPSPAVSVYPPWTKGGENTLACGWGGGGVSIRTTGKKPSTLSTFCRWISGCALNTQLSGTYIHRKKKVREFPVPSRDVTTKLSLGGNNDVTTELFLHRGSLVSDIPAGDGKLVNLFLRCTLYLCDTITVYPVPNQTVCTSIYILRTTTCKCEIFIIQWNHLNLAWIESSFFLIHFGSGFESGSEIRIRNRIQNVYFGSGSDPDPAKSFGSLRIRIRNTVFVYQNPGSGSRSGSGSNEYGYETLHKGEKRNDDYTSNH